MLIAIMRSMAIHGLSLVNMPLKTLGFVQDSINSGLIIDEILLHRCSRASFCTGESILFDK